MTEKKWGLIAPDNTPVELDNLRAFAKKEFGKNFLRFVQGIADVKRGKKESHQGWRVTTYENIKYAYRVGNKINRLTIVKGSKKDKFGNYLYKCRCDCGNIKYYYAHQLKTEDVVSCGCKRRKTLDGKNVVCSGN